MEGMKILEDFNFKIIEMNAFTKNEKTKLKYYLLVDQDNFIHDFKIEFELLEINTFTTKSHKNHDTNKIKLRIKIIESYLLLKHKFKDEDNFKKRIAYSNISKDKIEELNKKIWNDDMRQITFQDVEYLLTGSNPSGQGNGKGYLNTSFENDVVPFGFFLQVLNIKKQIDKQYGKSKNQYEVLWKEFWHNQKQDKKISFDKWLNENEILRKYLKSFKYSSSNWKNLFDKFKKELNENKQKWFDLNSKIIKLRKNQKEAFKKFFESNSLKNDNKTINQFAYEYFWSINHNKSSSRFQYAHIKPVKYIREQYKQTQNDKILDEINDINNFLPLPSDIHELYDKFYFYWEKNGKIQNLKEISKDDLKRMQKFSQINKNILETRKKYLDDYLKYLKSHEIKN